MKKRFDLCDVSTKDYDLKVYALIESKTLTRGAQDYEEKRKIFDELFTRLKINSEMAHIIAESKFIKIEDVESDDTAKIQKLIQLFKNNGGLDNYFMFVKNLSNKEKELIIQEYFKKVGN